MVHLSHSTLKCTIRRRQGGRRGFEYRRSQEVAVSQAEEVHSMIDIRRMLTEPLGVKRKPTSGGMRN